MAVGFDLFVKEATLTHDGRLLVEKMKAYTTGTNESVIALYESALADVHNNRIYAFCKTMNTIARDSFPFVERKYELVSISKSERPGYDDPEFVFASNKNPDAPVIYAMSSHEGSDAVFAYKKTGPYTSRISSIPESK